MPFPTSHRGEPPGSGHLGVVQATIQLLHYYYIPSIKKLNKRSERTASGFATDSRKFATDVREFADRVREDSRGFARVREDSRPIREFARIREDSRPIREFARINENCSKDSRGLSKS